MKKFIAATLVLALVFALAACDTPATGGDAGDAGSKLTVWCWDPAFNLFAMEEAAKVYKQINPGFELDIVEIGWDDLQTNLITIAMSGQLQALPDIFLVQNNAFQKNVMNYPELFADLTDFSVPYHQFGPSVVAYSTIGGRNFGVPFDNGAAVAAYRLDILEEAGYTLEDFTDITWDTYIEQAKDILAKTGKPLLSGGAGDMDLICILLQSMGASFFDADGNPDIVGNEYISLAFDVYVQLVSNGLMVEVNSWDEYIGTFNNGIVAGVINGCWILGSVQQADDQFGLWGITNLPKFSNVSGATHYSANGGSSWAVASSSSNVDLAVDFLTQTFGGSIEFYENILFAAGALANWLPAGESDVYNEPQPFFRDVPIYALITEFAGLIPSNYTGVYYYEARDAIGNAIVLVLAGADKDEALKDAEDTLRFWMMQ
ncbi:MAG: ABC transporter substrate-binding protein [Defluviitaleaceae bacterium]|nr:ABC transporter substrate-binding protein [Defluviitaleaceae bacterium]MCL2836098.1 ABC transporter substrate-binding protein [Defluviitaleaceae bacterium]